MHDKYRQLKYNKKYQLKYNNNSKDFKLFKIKKNLLDEANIRRLQKLKIACIVKFNISQNDNEIIAK